MEGASWYCTLIVHAYNKPLNIHVPKLSHIIQPLGRFNLLTDELIHREYRSTNKYITNFTHIISENKPCPAAKKEFARAWTVLGFNLSDLLECQISLVCIILYSTYFVEYEVVTTD